MIYAEEKQNEFDILKSRDTGKVSDQGNEAWHSDYQHAIYVQFASKFLVSCTTFLSHDFLKSALWLKNVELDKKKSDKREQPYQKRGMLPGESNLIEYL